MASLNWRVCPPAPPALLSCQPDIPPLLVQLLYNRGLSDPAELEPFLAADRSRSTFDPFLLPDMDKAVTRVLRALLGGETVAVYGDFDADGVTATAILVQGLDRLGTKAIPYIPHRTEEGHGLNLNALKTLKQQGCSLVITVDCGINGVSEVEEAQQSGLDLIITDHHVPPPVLPPAIAVIDPKRADSHYPFAHLAGVGVAFKFLEALFRATGREQECDQFLDLVALGTVTDLMPLVGENRYLVKQGLEALNHRRRPGLRAMLRCAGLGTGNIDAETIAYSLGPRINATGRLDHAMASYDILTTISNDLAQSMAGALEQLNAERQRQTANTFVKAKVKLGDTDSPIFVLGDADYPEGVLGLVANKLVDEFYRPAIVYRRGEETTRGSGRSIAEFDLFAAFSQCQDLFTRFGGHTMAAGFTLPTANLAELERRLLEIASRQLSGVILQPSLVIDAEVPLDGIGGDTFKMISRLAPFGKGNAAPTFLSRRVKVAESRFIGNKGDHLKLKLRQGQATWDAIMFNHNGRCLTPCLDIVFNLETDSWGGTEVLRLNIADFVPAT